MKTFIEDNKVKVIFIGIMFLLINWLSYYFRVTYSNDFLNAFNYLFTDFFILFRAFPLSLNITDISVSFGFLVVIIMLIIDKQNNKKNYRSGSHGSAKWGVPAKDLKGMYDEKDNYRNIIFSQNTQKALLNEGISPKLRRNNNVLVVGGSGSGKTRFMLKPNIMQTNADYVVTDPKGTILNETGYILRKSNYKIKVLNLIDFDKSMRYNPFHYIRNEQDILKVVDTIIKNTSGDSKEDFWVKAERLLYQAYIGVILQEFPKEEQHLGTVVDLLELSITKENDEDYKNAIDDMFDELAEIDPNSFCVKQYRQFKLAAGETTKSILISCGARLAPINIPAVRHLLSADEIDIDKIGSDNRPNALFVIIPDTDSTFNFIVSIMYSQMFNLLCTIADNDYGGEMPRHIRFMLDEFANIGEIPNFDKLIATIRSRNISATVILQTLAQLKSIYKDSADTITGNCDTFIFLGGKEEGTLKMLSSQLGKETIDDYNTSKTRSNSDSYGQNYSKLGRELMTVDELQTMDRSKCIVMILGLNPFKDDKYDIVKHPKYHMHANGIDSKYWFDYPKYLENLRKPRISDEESIEDYSDVIIKINEIEPIQEAPEFESTKENDDNSVEDSEVPIYVEIEEEETREYQPEEMDMSDFF